MACWPETGQWAEATPVSGGHIHHSLRLSTDNGLYFLQKLNERVFRDHSILEENLNNLEGAKLDESSLKMPLPVRSINGQLFERDQTGDLWRLFPWLEGVSDLQNHYAQAVGRVASRFGEWAGAVNQLDVYNFQSPLPGFHHLPSIWEAFYHAWDQAGGDRKHLAAETSARLAEGVEALDLFDQLTAGMPERIIHGDPKPDNQLQLTDSDAIAILDLDTVMPGYLWMETGDMVRSMAVKSAEDDPDLQKAGIDPEKAGSVLKSYAQAVSDWATEAELASLRYGPLCIILEQALRFLTDYLKGDQYYHTEYSDHNFVRAQNQLLVWESYADWVGF